MFFARKTLYADVYGNDFKQSWLKNIFYGSAQRYFKLSKKSINLQMYSQTCRQCILSTEKSSSTFNFGKFWIQLNRCLNLEKINKRLALRLRCPKSKWKLNEMSRRQVKRLRGPWKRQALTRQCLCGLKYVKRLEFFSPASCFAD